MAAQVASLYYTILTTEARLAIARDNAALQLRSLQITELLFRGGNEAELDVQQARTLYLAPSPRSLRSRSACARRRTP